MFSRAMLINIALFMERAQATGKEALAWSETYQAVVAQINALDESGKHEKPE